MSAKDILIDNVEMKNGSFLHYLHNKSEFNNNAFKKLYAAIRVLADEEVDISRTAQNINYVYGQILKCLLFHFDKNDEFKISNLPENYSKLVSYLDNSVEYYFKTRI
ncbi:MAG: hypothetical protein IJ677_05770 [Alphaproteobacteria bacterium]|nr:hypothetical protein [Alphaproteobacteria bacterium]